MLRDNETDGEITQGYEAEHMVTFITALVLLISITVNVKQLNILMW